MKNKSDLFTIGELAKLFAISKQTILYYERIGLLLPDQVGDNGYRYYRYDQCRELEMILALKKLGLQLKEVGIYLKSISPLALAAIYEQARAELDQKLEQLYSNKLRIEMLLYHLRREPQMPRNLVLFQLEEEQTYFLTKRSHCPATHKDRVVELMKHKRILLERPGIRTFSTGCVLDGNKFTQNKLFDFSHYCTRLDMPEEGLPAAVRPRGLYLIMYVSGAYHSQAVTVRRQFGDFMERNGLDSCGSLYVEPVCNYCTETDKRNYVTKVSLAVMPEAQKEER